MPLVNTVHVRENGPYALNANIQYANGTGQRMTLCRCGESKSKPYCDGSHTTAKFIATGDPEITESAAPDARDGPLNLDPRPDGPLHVSGNLEICAGTGHTVNRVTETYLCRCGHSSSKPFCDGTHAKIGFKSN